MGRDILFSHLPGQRRDFGILSECIQGSFRTFPLWICTYGWRRSGKEQLEEMSPLPETYPHRGTGFGGRTSGMVRTWYGEILPGQRKETRRLGWSGEGRIIFGRCHYLVEKLGERSAAYGNGAKAKSDCLSEWIFLFRLCARPKFGKEDIGIRPLCGRQTVAGTEGIYLGCAGQSLGGMDSDNEAHWISDCSPHDCIEWNSMGGTGSETGTWWILPSARSAIQAYGYHESELPYPRFAGIL